MNGKSNVFHYLNSTGEKRILVIADGAAFGSEIDRVLQLLKTKKNAVLYLPESFEWLILSSGVLKSSIVENLLKEPPNISKVRNTLVGSVFSLLS